MKLMRSPGGEGYALEFGPLRVSLWRSAGLAGVGVVIGTRNGLSYVLLWRPHWSLARYRNFRGPDKPFGIRDKIL